MSNSSNASSNHAGLATRAKQRRGASLTSYGLVVGLISVVALATVTSIGSNVLNLFEQVGTNLNEVTEIGPAPATPTLTGTIAGDGVISGSELLVLNGDAESGSTVTATASDGSGGSVSGSDVANSPWEITLDLGTLEDGSITVEIVAELGGKSSAPLVDTLTKDTGAPVWQTAANLGSIGTGQGVGQTLVATDDGTVTYSIDSDPSDSLTFTLDGSTGALGGSTSTPGTYSVTVLASDEFGNTTPRTFSVEVQAPQNGCSSSANYVYEIASDLYLCAVTNNTAQTWLQVYSACNQSGGFHLTSVGPMTARGIDLNSQALRDANIAAASDGFQFMTSGQPARSCDWTGSDYESCNGLGYVSVRSDGTADTGNWGALTDGNESGLRTWPSANNTNAHPLVSLCHNASGISGAYVFDQRWRR